MMELVVDASVALKWYVPEIGSLTAGRLLSLPARLIAPDLIVPEIGNILWKLLRRADITPEQSLTILETFETTSLTLLPSVDLLRPALEMAVALDHGVYDCIYLALAKSRDCVMVTADRRFHTPVSASAFANHIHWFEDDL
jgi:predicted nucleic acid-binding protein